jgi:hypothetical protein
MSGSPPKDPTFKLFDDIDTFLDKVGQRLSTPTLARSPIAKDSMEIPHDSDQDLDNELAIERDELLAADLAYLKKKRILHDLSLALLEEERILNERRNKDFNARKAHSLLLSSSDVSVTPPVVPSSLLVYQAATDASCTDLSLLTPSPPIALLDPITSTASPLPHVLSLLMSSLFKDALHASLSNALITLASPLVSFLYTWIRVRKKRYIIINNYIFTFKTSPSPPYAIGCLEVALFTSGPSSTGVGNPLQSGVINYLKYEQCFAADVKALTHTIYSIHCTTLIIISIILHLLYYYYTTHVSISVARIVLRPVYTTSNNINHVNVNYITPDATSLHLLCLVHYSYNMATLLTLTINESPHFICLCYISFRTNSLVYYLHKLLLKINQNFYYNIPSVCL